MTTTIKKGGVVAWILLPIFVILFFVGGFLLGIMYQRRKAGWEINPFHSFGKKDKIRSSADGDDTRFDGVEAAGRHSADVGDHALS